MGWAAEDPRVDAMEGVLVVPGGKLALHDKLGVTGIAIVVDRVYVSVGAGGVYLGRNDSARHLTNDQAIDGAIAVHRVLASANCWATTTACPAPPRASPGRMSPRL